MSRHNLGQVPCKNCKVASSHWIRFTETTYPKLCQQKYKNFNFMEDPSTKRLKHFRTSGFQTPSVWLWYSIRIYIYMALVKLSSPIDVFVFFPMFLESIPARTRIGLSRNMAHMPPSSPQRLGMNPISLDSPRCVDMAPMLRRKSGALESKCFFCRKTLGCWIDTILDFLLKDDIWQELPLVIYFPSWCGLGLFFHEKITDSQCCLWCWNASNL